MELKFILLYTLIASFLELDTLYIGQFMVSRPIVAGVIFGLLTGDFTASVTLGFWTELLFINHKPIGTSIPPSEFACVVFAIILHTVADIGLAGSFFAGVVFAYIFQYADKCFRNKVFKGYINPAGLVSKALFARIVFVWLFFSTFSVFAYSLVNQLNYPKIWVLDKALFLTFCLVPIVAIAKLVVIFAKKNG